MDLPQAHQLPPSAPGGTNDSMETDAGGARGEGRINQLKQFENLVLPKGDPDAKSANIGDKKSAAVNAWPLNTEELRSVFKHQLDFTCFTDRKEFLLHTSGQRTDVRIQMRRNALNALLPMVFSRHAANFRATPGQADVLKDEYAFDGGCLLYMREHFDSFEGKLEEADFTDPIRELLGNRVTHIIYKFQYVKQVWDKDWPQWRRYEQEVVQFLEVLTWQKLDPSRHILYGNKAYYTSKTQKETSLGSGHVIKYGFEKGIRQMGFFLVVQMNTKVSPFYGEQPLIDLLRERRMLQDLERAGASGSSGDRDRGSSSALRKASKELCNIAMTTTHMKTNKTFPLHKFARTTARTQTFLLKGREEISVEDYYQETYKISLKYPNLPLVEEYVSAKKMSFYPMELLKVHKGQRVPNSKSTPEMIEQLIKFAQMKPGRYYDCLKDQQNKARLDGDANRLWVNFGLAVHDDMVEVECDVVQPPAVRMAGNSSVQKDFKFPERFKIGNRDGYSQPAKQSGNILVLLNDVDERMAGETINRLFQCGRDHGMQLDPRKVSYKSVYADDKGALEHIFQDIKAKKDKTDIVFLFTKDKRDPAHDTVKLLEMKYGILTQHIFRGTMEQIVQGKPLCVNNVVQKMNQKMGGLNYSIEMAPELSKTARDVYERTSRTIKAGTTMAIGLSVSHAGPQSFADRQAGVPQSEPTIIGMSYTIGEMTRLRGHYWMQDARVAHIMTLDIHIVTALKAYHAEKRDMPENIIIYRAGLSEGEFKMAASETQQVLAAAASVANLARTPHWTPNITTLFVMTGSNYRLLPPEQNDGRRAYMTDDNVPPGTIAGLDAVNPNLKEWIMVPQRAIMGTARPIRVTIVAEHKGATGTTFTMDDLKVITNSLCYAHGIVTSPVHAPAPLMSAEALTKRGRANYKEELSNNDNCTIVSGSSGGEYSGDLRNDGTPDFFARLSNKFSTKLPNNHYWA